MRIMQLEMAGEGRKEAKEVGVELASMIRGGEWTDSGRRRA